MDQNNAAPKSLDLNLACRPDSADDRRFAFAFISLFFILIVIYSNSFHGVFVFDDSPRIVKNEYIRMERLDFESLTNPLRDEITGEFRLWRPLAFLTFALNYYTGGLDVTGFHVFNLIIHYLAACFLFLFVHAMLNLPMLREKYGKISYPLALLTSVFWAVHPIQVTSVTYIVQRMASMAGMFYIAAMYFYLKGRFSVGKSRWAWFAAAGASGLCAVASKENAVLLAPSLALLELVLTQGASKENIIRFARWTFWICALGALAVFLASDPFRVFLDYSFRPYTMWERLITQPRVMMLYLGLLFYPTSGRMTFLYDVPHSISLAEPVSTLFSLMAVLGLILMGMVLIKRSPLISFCILFFLLNHIIESTILPLEMVFEHRNYIPSFFFFLPLFVFIFLFLTKFTDQPSLRFLTLSLVVFLIISNGHTTYFRNAVFGSSASFWGDNVNKSPNLHVPINSLGVYFFNNGMKQRAIACFRKANSNDRMENNSHRAKNLFNIGMGFFEVYNKPLPALSYFMASHALDKSLSENFLQIAMCHMMLDQPEKALDWLNRGLEAFPDESALLRVKALLQLKSGLYDQAVVTAHKAKTGAGNEHLATLVMAEASRKMGKRTMAIHLFTMAHREMPNYVGPILALIELGAEINDKDTVDNYVRLLFSKKKDKRIDALINVLIRNGNIRAYVPKKKLLLSAIEESIGRELGLQNQP